MSEKELKALVSLLDDQDDQIVTMDDLVDHPFREIAGLQAGHCAQRAGRDVHHAAGEDLTIEGAHLDRVAFPEGTDHVAHAGREQAPGP